MHAHVHSRLLEHGLDYLDIEKSAEEVVVFGSTAAGMQGAGSDLDIVCIGNGKDVRTPRLDLLWVSRADIDSDRWVASELGGHVAAFGVWLKGDGPWRNRVAISPKAIASKHSRIARRLTALERAFPSLRQPFRVRQLEYLRRHMQRYLLLARGEAVPCTPLLDSAFSNSLKTLDELARDLGGEFQRRLATLLSAPQRVH